MVFLSEPSMLARSIFGLAPQSLQNMNLYHKITCIEPETEKVYFFMSGLPTEESHNISRDRKTMVYSKSYAEKVLLICSIISLIIFL